MDVRTVIEQRRTIHEFSGESVADSLVEEALNLALWAPNHKLTFPWKFYWAGYQTKQKLIALSLRLKELKTEKPMSEAVKRGLESKLNNCAHMIVVGCDLTQDPFQQREDYATVSCGLQNTMLFLESRGVGSKWSTGAFTRDEKTYEILNVDPAKVDLVGVLLVGHYAKKPKTPARPELNQFLSKLS